MYFTATSFKDFFARVKALEIAFDYQFRLKVTGRAKTPLFMPDLGKSDEVYLNQDDVTGWDLKRKSVYVRHTLGLSTTYALKDSCFPLNFKVVEPE